MSQFPSLSDLPDTGIYTRDIYKYRIWSFGISNIRAWILDGADYRGNVSWTYWTFSTHALALAALPAFAKAFPLVEANRIGRRIASVKSTLPRRPDCSVWLRTGVRIGWAEPGKSVFSEFTDAVKSQMLDGTPGAGVPSERKLPRNAGLERSGRD